MNTDQFKLTREERSECCLTDRPAEAIDIAQKIILAKVSAYLEQNKPIPLYHATLWGTTDITEPDLGINFYATSQEEAERYLDWMNNSCKEGSFWELNGKAEVVADKERGIDKEKQALRDALEIINNRFASYDLTDEDKAISLQAEILLAISPTKENGEKG